MGQNGHIDSGELAGLIALYMFRYVEQLQGVCTKKNTDNHLVFRV